MVNRSIRAVITLVAVIGVLTACTPGAPPAPTSESFTTQLQAVTDAVVASSGYAKDVVEVTGSRVRLRIEIADAALATADQATRETKAVDVVGAAERAMAVQPELAGVQAVSVAILHGTGAGGWHVEDVLDFRKSPNGHFSFHGTS
jgi:hypothetical protein